MTLFPGLFSMLMILLGNVESDRRHGWLSRSGEAQRLRNDISKNDSIA
jgi:hypothetical protein